MNAQRVFLIRIVIFMVILWLGIGSIPALAGTEVFEERSAQAINTFVVNTVSDTGDGICDSAECTLREAILASNAYPGADAISFAIPGDGMQVIQPLTALPVISDTLTIDGFTQPGAQPNTNPITQGSNAIWKIGLDGINLSGLNSIGLYWLWTSANTVRGLVISGFHTGMFMDVVGDWSHVEGNFVHSNLEGLVVYNGDVMIGGLAPEARNIISGNTWNGIRVGEEAFLSPQMIANALIQGNFIGTDPGGISAMVNGKGVIVLSGEATVGGTDLAARNVISGNGTAIQGVYADMGISGNYIGTDLTGKTALPNGVAILLQRSDTTGIAGNVISGNAGHAIEIFDSWSISVEDNFIGTDSTNTLSLGNGGVAILLTGDSLYSQILRNAIAYNAEGIVMYGQEDYYTAGLIKDNLIYANNGLGIDLNGDGVTLNDEGDGDSGANGLQNYPILTEAQNTNGITTLAGSLNSTPNQTFTLQFFANHTCDPSGYGEGEIFLGSATVTTDSAGNVSFTFIPPSWVPPGQYVTATSIASNGYTSEFSQCLVVTEAPPDTTPPVCEWTIIPNVGAIGTIQDYESGLAVITVAQQQNVIVTVPEFEVGTTAPVEVTITVQNPQQWASVSLRIQDVIGNRVQCKKTLPPRH